MAVGQVGIVPFDAEHLKRPHVSGAVFVHQAARGDRDLLDGKNDYTPSIQSSLVSLGNLANRQAVST